MKKNNKKGFTIVELVIVIAVIAILAAVLIPTFSSVVKKAKVNNDIQLVRNLNTALAADNKEHATMQSALDAAFEFGYDVAKINDTSVDENKILWDSKNDVFCYLKDGTLEYVPNSVADDDKLSVGSYLLWKISDTVDPVYSTYLYGYEGTTVTAKKGLDVGKTEGITEIEYVNDTAQEVVIRTNSSATEITVNAPNDNVAFYGEGTIATGSIFANMSAHIYGEFSGSIAQGRVVYHVLNSDKVIIAENSGVIVALSESALTSEYKVDIKYATGVDHYYVQITSNDGEMINQTRFDINESGATVGETTDATNNTVDTPAAISESIVITQGAVDPAKAIVGLKYFAGGTGTESDPFLIVDYDTFQHVSMFDWYGVALNYYYSGHSWSDSRSYADANALSTYYGKINYFKVKPGITEIDCANWKPVYLYGCIDGSNVTLKNLDKNLFQEAYAYDSNTSSYVECLIENFNVEAKISYSGAASAIAQSAGPVIRFKNVNISGKIEGNYVGSYFTFGAGQFESDSNGKPTVAGQYTFENCTSSATLQCNSIGEGGAGGFIHHPYGATGTTITIKDSKYTGTMYVFSGKSHGYVSCFDATTVVFDYSEGFEQGTYTTTNTEKSNSSNYVYPAPNFVSVSGSKHGQLSNYDVIEINAVPNASYATATLFIAPNPGALLYPALQETLTLENGKFTTITVRKYDITWNGEVKDVITGNNYEVGGNGGYTGINGSYIIINQYSSDGTLLSSDQYTVSGKLGN